MTWHRYVKFLRLKCEGRHEGRVELTEAMILRWVHVAQFKEGVVETLYLRKRKE